MRVDLRQCLVGEQPIGVGDRRRHAFEIERQANAGIFLAGILLQRLARIFVDDALLGLLERCRSRAVAGEIQQFDQIGVAAVGQLLGKGVVAVDAFGQDLAHEGLRIAHVFEAVRLDRIVIKPRVGEEVVDRFDVADIGQVIFGLARDIRLLGYPFQRCGEVCLLSSCSWCRSSSRHVPVHP